MFDTTMTQSELSENLDEKNLSPSDKKADKQKNLTQALFDYVVEKAEAPVASTSETSKTSNLPEPKIVEWSQKDQLETSKLPEPIELINGMARRYVKVALARGTDNRRSFSEERIKALLPDKRKEKLTIEEKAKYCAKISDAMDIFTHYLDLGPKNDYENEIVTSGNTESKEFDSKLETSDSSKPQIQASLSSQTIEIDSMLAEIDA
ncbi:33850_t:CDS:2, partial [Racocetra persica]